MPLKSKIVDQFSWVTAGNVVAAALRAGSLVLVARALLPAEFGLFSAATGAAIVLQAVFDLGLAKLIVHERAGGDKDSSMVAAALRLNTKLSVLLGSVCFVVLLILGLTLSPTLLLMLPMSVSISGEKNADTWLGVPIADGNARPNSLNLVGRRSVALIGLVIGLASGVNPILAFCLGEALAAVVSVVFARFYVRHLMKDYSEIPVRSVLRASGPFWINGLAMQVRNLDVMLASFLAGTTQAGYYSAASRLTGPLQLLPSSLAVVILPAASRGSDRPHLVKIVMAASGVMCAGYVALAAVTPWLLPILLGPAYSPAVPVIQIVILGLPFASAAALMSAMLQGWRYATHVAAIAICTSALCLGGIGVGAEFYKALGAAVGLSAAYVVQTILLGALCASALTRSGPQIRRDAAWQQE